jgi:hypothetical protein
MFEGGGFPTPPIFWIDPDEMYIIIHLYKCLVVAAPAKGSNWPAESVLGKGFSKRKWWRRIRVIGEELDLIFGNFTN